MPDATTYGLSFDTTYCYCYPVGADLLSASSCFACKAWSACDERPVVINTGAT